MPILLRRTAALRTARIASAVLFSAVALAGLAELLLPGIIEQRVRDRLERDFGGEVTSLEVEGSALWALVDGPDRVTFEMEHAKRAEGFQSAGKAGEVDGRFGTLSHRGFEAHDVRFRKSGERFELRMEVPDTVDAPIGIGAGLELTASSDGTLEAVLPDRDVRLEVAASQGDIVVRPHGLGPIGSSLATVTLVNLPSLEIEDLGAEAAGERVELSLDGGVTA